MSAQERLSLAHSFVFKLKANLEKADRLLDEVKPDSVSRNIMEDGELLLLQPVVERVHRLDRMVIGRIKDQKTEMSLTDFFDALDLAVRIDIDAGTAKGWYLRENRVFDLDIERGNVLTMQGDYALSDSVQVEDGDLWVPVDELEKWIDFDLYVDVSVQELRIETDVPLPFVSKISRSQFKDNLHRVPEVSRPRGDDSYKEAVIPVIDVSTNSTYRRRGQSNSKSQADHAVNIKSVGDLAKGTVTTNLRMNNTDQLTTARVNYKRETVDGELLGPLKAKKMEIGDISTVRQPFAGFSAQELGVRATNTDPTKRFTTPTTGISGSAIPGWDVELYRNDRLLAVQEVPDDGFYQFSNVDLYLNDNNFRLVFYGPQGEIREEEVFVPVDRSLLSQNKGIYDISLSLDGENTYNHFNSDDEDEGSLRVSALYEKPLPAGVTGLVGIRSSEQNGLRNTVANIGASATINQALINAGLAIDDEGEMSANLVARRDFSEHEVRNAFNWVAADFDQDSLRSSNFSEGESQDSFSNRFQIDGPIHHSDGYRLQYSASSDYSWTGEGNYNLLTSLGLNMGMRSLNANGLLRHQSGSHLEDDHANANLNLSGRLLKNRFRLSANYEVMPESDLDNISAFIQRDLTNDLEIEVSATQRPQLSLTEYQARLDWQAGFIRLSPSIRYNSENDFFAGLNTRFGLVKDPATDKFKMYDENLTNFGMLSAFVYLDKDGDGVFNGADEPLEDVIVTAPQSGRRLKTDEHGVALFHRLRRLRLTDIYLDKDTLQDPVWIPGFEGISVLPREGYVAEVEFPVHMSGEIDGTVYARSVGDSVGEGNKSTPVALRNITLNLYNDEGEIEQATNTDVTGFYYFTQIPPGRYLLMIDEASAEDKNIIRPPPQPIEIGYDGTIIYSNNITVQAGEGDIPTAIKADMESYKNNHPHINFNKDYELVLNLGEYNSRLMMSVIWYKLRARYMAIIGKGDLFVPPSESYADAETGKHTLRIGYKNVDIEEGYKRCRALMARDQYCKVEIYPAFMKQARAEIEPGQ